MVTVSVIDRLEPIKVERKHTNRSVSFPAVDNACSLLKKPSAIAKADQVVCPGLPQELAVVLVANELEQGHGQYDRIQDAFVDRDLADDRLYRLPVLCDQPGQKKGSEGIQQGMSPCDGHDNVPRTQRFHPLASKHLASRHGAYKGDRKGAYMVPHDCVPLLAPDGPHRSHPGKQSDWTGAVMTDAQ